MSTRRNATPRIATVTPVILLLFASWIGRVTAADSLVLELASGRSFAGVVDAQTDDAHLWLRCGTSNAYVVRPIEWHRILRARLGDASLTSDALREKVLAGNVPTQARPKSHPSPLESGTTVNIASADNDASPAFAGNAPQPARVQALAIEARAANWDSGVEVDGVLVSVAPLDADGNIVAVHGTLEVDLVVERGITGGPGRAFHEIGHWTCVLSPEQVRSRGATFRLPFQAVHPEFRLNVASIGLVHARLSVPGEGVFDASATAVRVRPYSVVRDRLEQTDGGRFFPNERTLRGQVAPRGMP